MWVCRGVGKLICISEGGKGSIDEAFSIAICLTCVCFGPYSLNVRGQGPPGPPCFLRLWCVCVHVCVCVCVCVHVCFVHVCVHQ